MFIREWKYTTLILKVQVGIWWLEERVTEYPPNNTLYVSNLNEKIPVDDIKEILFDNFEEFGEIIDVKDKIF